MFSSKPWQTKEKVPDMQMRYLGLLRRLEDKAGKYVVGDDGSTAGRRTVNELFKFVVLLRIGAPRVAIHVHSMLKILQQFTL